MILKFDRSMSIIKFLEWQQRIEQVFYYKDSDDQQWPKIVLLKFKIFTGTRLQRTRTGRKDPVFLKATC